MARLITPNGPPIALNRQSLSNIPIPDPSEITTTRLNEMADQLRMEFRSAIAAAEAVIDMRIVGVDQAIESDRNKSSEEHKRSELLRSERLTHFTDKLIAIHEKFKDRDDRADLDRKAAATAVSTALEVVKDAAAKSEVSVTKEIDSLKTLIGTMRDGYANELRNITSRIDRGEGTTTGVRQKGTDTQANVGMIVAIVGGAVGFVSMVVLVFGLTLGHGGDKAQPVTPSAEYLGAKLDLLLKQNGKSP